MKRSLLLSGLTYAIFLIGLLTLNGRVIALTIPFIIYMGAALLFGPKEPKLAISRKLSADRVHHGTPVEVNLTVSNLGPELEEVMLADLIPAPLQIIEGAHRTLGPLASGESVEINYSLLAKRGNYTFSDLVVKTSDQLGIIRKQATLDAPVHLLVLPESQPLPRIPIRPLQTHGYAGPVPARKGGSGVDFYGVREYQLGDPLRWINWRQSARHPQAMFSNEFEQERIADVGLILDARRRSDIHSQNDSLFEYSVQAAASIADTFLKDGNRVGLLVYGGFLDWIFPGYGKIQRERILQALSRAKTGESLIFDTLDFLPTRFFPARSQIVILSPLNTDDFPILVRLRARGYQVMVISPDPVSFEATILRNQTQVGLAFRIARLERALLLRKLRTAGILVVDWPVTRPLEEAIQRSLGRRPAWFRAIGLGASL